MRAQSGFSTWLRVALSVVVCFASAQSERQNIFIQPLGGEHILAGYPYQIRWRPVGNSGPVFIQLSYGDNKKYGNITTSTENNGSFWWTPGPELAGLDLFLVMCNVDSSIAGTTCSYTYNGRLLIIAGANSPSPSSLSLTTVATVGGSTATSKVAVIPSSIPFSSTAASDTSVIPTLIADSSLSFTSKPTGFLGSVTTSSMFTTSSLLSGTTTSAVPGTDTTTGSTAVATSSPNSSSKTATIVTGILVPITVIALAVAALVIMRRIRKNRPVIYEIGYNAKSGNRYPAELPGEYLIEKPGKIYRGAWPVHELAT